MKKILAILSFSVFISFSAQAQNNNEELHLEMDNMMQHMQEMMKSFGSWMGEAPMIMDTMIIREFQFPGDELDNMMQQFSMGDLNNLMFQFSPDSLMNKDMFKGMEDMMQQWSNQDMTDMEEFFKDIEKLMPTLPENEQQGPSDKKNKTKKKRKTTTL